MNKMQKISTMELPNIKAPYWFFATIAVLVLIWLLVILMGRRREKEKRG